MDKYLLDGHKLYWHMDRLSEWQKGGMIPPIYVEISPVSFCNHNCIFCGVDFAKVNHRALDTDVLCKALIEMAQLGIRSVMFAGEGEPILHKDIALFVRKAKQSGIDVSLTTNGSKGKYQVWMDIIPYLSWIRFSVDAGTPEVYAKVHNVKESTFDEVIKSIGEAIRVKKDYKLETTIGVQFLLLEENICDLEAAINLFCSIGVNYIVFKPYSLHPQMINKKYVTYSMELVDRVQRIIDKHKSKTETEIIFRKDSLIAYVNGNKNFDRCWALPFWGYISSDGNFYTCSVFLNDNRFNSGNIYNQSMYDIIFGNKRSDSINYGKNGLSVEKCRTNCRMARINEFLQFIANKPSHVNFI